MGKPASITISKKKAMVAAALIACVGFSGVVVSGAYFTDEVSSTGNTASAGTVYLGPIGATDNTPVTFSNILPSTPENGRVTTINVRNIGTAAINWAATLNLPASTTADQRAFAGQLNIQTSIDGGVTWSAATTLAAYTTAATAGSVTSTAALPAPVGTTPSAAPIQLRMWLPTTTLNTYQGKSLTFNVRVRAIQSDAGAGQLTTESNFAPTNPVPTKP